MHASSVSFRPFPTAFCVTFLSYCHCCIFPKCHYILYAKLFNFRVPSLVILCTLGAIDFLLYRFMVIDIEGVGTMHNSHDTRDHSSVIDSHFSRTSIVHKPLIASIGTQEGSRVRAWCLCNCWTGIYFDEGAKDWVVVGMSWVYTTYQRENGLFPKFVKIFTEE